MEIYFFVDMEEGNLAHCKNISRFEFLKSVIENLCNNNIYENVAQGNHIDFSVTKASHRCRNYTHFRVSICRILPQILLE
jgi:hypothetical protein